jgi:hypothetical protein
VAATASLGDVQRADGAGVVLDGGGVWAMSAASEWAKHVADHTRPRFASARISAECNDHGDLASVEIETEAVPPEEAVRFATWILETFGNPSWRSGVTSGGPNA